MDVHLDELLISDKGKQLRVIGGPVIPLEREKVCDYKASIPFVSQMVVL